MILSWSRQDTNSEVRPFYFYFSNIDHVPVGRAQNAPFGNTHVELGCNWVQGLGTNPINELAKKYKLNTASTNGDDVVFYGEKGKIDGEAKYKKFNGYFEKMTDNVRK